MDLSAFTLLHKANSALPCSQETTHQIEENKAIGRFLSPFPGPCTYHHLWLHSLFSTFCRHRGEERTVRAKAGPGPHVLHSSIHHSCPYTQPLLSIGAACTNEGISPHYHAFLPFPLSCYHLSNSSLTCFSCPCYDPLLPRLTDATSASPH